MTELKRILMKRDGESSDSCDDRFEIAREDYDDGMHPEEILFYHFNLELDYIFDLLEEMGVTNG